MSNFYCSGYGKGIIEGANLSSDGMPSLIGNGGIPYEPDEEREEVPTAEEMTEWADYELERLGSKPRSEWDFEDWANYDGALCYASHKLMFSGFGYELYATNTGYKVLNGEGDEVYIPETTFDAKKWMKEHKVSQHYKADGTFDWDRYEYVESNCVKHKERHNNRLRKRLGIVY